MRTNYPRLITAELTRLGVQTSANNPCGFVVRATADPLIVKIADDSTIGSYLATDALDILKSLNTASRDNVWFQLWPASKLYSGEPRSC